MFDWGKDPEYIGALPFDRLFRIADQLSDWLTYKKGLRDQAEADERRQRGWGGGRR